LIPGQRNAGRVDGRDGEKDQRGKTEDRRDDRGEIFAEFESGKETAEWLTLKQLCQQ
jgi:hypothetical protein